MTPAARRIYPLVVLLTGILAALGVVALASRARRAERAHDEALNAARVATALEARIDAISHAVRGAALAFDLGALEPREVSGVLRLAYAQNADVTAVTLLDRDGSAVVPAVFLARAGAAAPSGRPPESLDDLDRFARQIPFPSALAHGRAVQGPYPSVHGDGARFAIAESVAVADGTRTWVLAAEIDCTHLLDGIAAGAADGEIALMAPTITVGHLSRVPDEARAAVRAATQGASAIGEPELLSGGEWRVAIARAPAGLDGVIAVAWAGEDALARRARQGDWALGVLVASIVGALAAGLAVALRESPAGNDDEGSAGGVDREMRVLGAVVKELANPIAATSAAAQLLASEPAKSRVAETVQRSAVRLERAFRRVARLARAGEETARTRVDLGATVLRELESLRPEIEQAGQRLVLDATEGDVMIDGDASDIAMLVQALTDAARASAPASGEIRVAVGGGARDPATLRVRDEGRLRARERIGMMQLGEATRTDTAAPALAWALAARIAADHRATMTIRDDGPSASEAVVTFG